MRPQARRDLKQVGWTKDQVLFRIGAGMAAEFPVVHLEIRAPSMPRQGAPFLKFPSSLAFFCPNGTKYFDNEPPIL